MHFMFVANGTFKVDNVMNRKNGKTDFASIGIDIRVKRGAIFTPNMTPRLAITFDLHHYIKDCMLLSIRPHEDKQFPC